MILTSDQYAELRSALLDAAMDIERGSNEQDRVNVWDGSMGIWDVPPLVERIQPGLDSRQVQSITLAALNDLVADGILWRVVDEVVQRSSDDDVLFEQDFTPIFSNGWPPRRGEIAWFTLEAPPSV
jgi:hypothetical protein